jgi:hypothetical protein
MLFGVLGAASVCGAESPWRRPVAPPVVPPYRVWLEEPGGTSLPTFRHRGTSYVLGEPGERYVVRVENPTAERVEAVVTVDGRDAVSGALGDYVNQRGYLIEPWGTLSIEGFRRSWDEVAAFRFTGRGQSYAARRGSPEHVGVIGVAIFPEQERPRRPIVQRRPREVPEGDDRAAPSAPRKAAGAPAPESRQAGPSNIGTAYGENRSSSVIEVAFQRRSPTHPSAVLRLRYDDYAGLEARGIDLSSLGYVERDPGEPEPFPLSRARFAPPPRD